MAHRLFGCSRNSAPTLNQVIFLLLSASYVTWLALAPWPCTMGVLGRMIPFGAIAMPTGLLTLAFLSQAMCGSMRAVRYLGHQRNKRHMLLQALMWNTWLSLSSFM